MRSEPHSPEFHVEYANLLAALPRERAAARPLMVPGTMKALIHEYRNSPDFVDLADKTKKDYDRALKNLDSMLIFRPADIKRKHLVTLRNAIANRNGNRTADLFISAVSAVFRVGLDLDYALEVNPAHDIRRIARSESYLPWPAVAQQAFEASGAPVWLLTGYHLGLGTSLRLADVLKLTRNRYDGRGFHTGHSKTRKGEIADEGYIPASPRLRAYLQTLPATGLRFVCDSEGRPIAERHFSGVLRAQLDALGFPELVFHGLRHTIATELAERGASDKEIMAVTGHSTPSMVLRYTKKANQKRLATQAMGKLGPNTDEGT